MSKKNEPYNPNLPDMPPLIDDVILPSKTNTEAEERDPTVVSPGAI